MNEPLIVNAVVQDGKVHIPDQDGYRKLAKRAAKRWGDGTALKIRIEPEDEAYSYGDLKHYWGHVITPLSEWNGDFKEDWHLRLKADFMPEGKTSLTQLNRDELKEYTLRCEVYAHTAHPEAFTLYDTVRTHR